MSASDPGTSEETAGASPMSESSEPQAEAWAVFAARETMRGWKFTQPENEEESADWDHALLEFELAVRDSERAAMRTTAND